MYRDRYKRNARLLGAALILLGVVALIYVSRSHGQVVIILGLIIVAGVVTSGAGQIQGSNKQKFSKKARSSLGRSFNKWWHS
jgi:uncharacterized membrane protein HdeD (DUF308 family)